MDLKKLFAGHAVKIYGEADVLRACSHSKSVRPGDLFIVRKRYDFIDEAISAGASAIFTDLYDPFCKIPQVVGNVEELLFPVVARLCDHPEKKLRLIGITGTNGKTTTAFLIHHLLPSCGMLGTIEYRIGDHIIPATLTTPDLVTIMGLLSDMVRAGCTSCVMEVSSHALLQGRVKGLPFSDAIFTNLSQDHLDYHKTMEEYFAAKCILFENLSEDATAYLNRDDPWSEKIETCAKKVFYEKYRGEMPLAGEFNKYNVAAAVACTGKSDFTNFSGVPGRMERIENDIYVDFAHTPDALASVLASLKSTCKGKLTVVFGCGGDRDAEKRPLMGKIAKKYADRIIVTSDNPRTENPEKICREIGCEKVIVDRKEAIETAIFEASIDDIVLIAGRGHEPFQTIGTQKIPFDDRKIAKEACAKSEKLLK